LNKQQLPNYDAEHIPLEESRPILVDNLHECHTLLRWITHRI